MEGEGETPKLKGNRFVTSPETGCATLSADLLTDQHPNTATFTPTGTWQSPPQMGQVSCSVWSFHFTRSSTQRAILPSAPWRALLHVRRGASHTGQRRELSGSCPGSLVWAQDLGKQGRPAKGTIMFPQTHRSIRIHSMHFTRAIKFYMQLSEIPNTANYPPK